MKVIKDVLLFSYSFHENNMFDSEHNINLYFVSEVFRPEVNRRIMKYDLNYCEHSTLDLIDLTVKITDMVILKKPGILQEVKKS